MLVATRWSHHPGKRQHQLPVVLRPLRPALDDGVAVGVDERSYFLCWRSVKVGPGRGAAWSGSSVPGPALRKAPAPVRRYSPAIPPDIPSTSTADLLAPFAL